MATARNLIPLPPLRRYDTSALPADLMAAVTVLFLAVPQGLAYATIAGLPPAVGLYASAVPTIVGSIFRSSSHVLSGPTNALSLLVGAAVAHGLGADPTEVALTLALMVGVLQVSAGVLRLGAIVDFISRSVVLGYITGAGVLIGIGQLYNAVGTTGDSGRVWVTLGGWARTLTGAQPIAIAVALGTVAIVVLVRIVNHRRGRRLPSAIIAMSLATAAAYWLGLEERGLKTIADVAEIPLGLPPLTLPNLSLAPDLIALAIACAVLSLVESSSVARSLSAKTRQQLDQSTEFFGQGLSNVAAAFFGGYPLSGSLARSSLNERVGAKTRMSGIIGGALMVIVLLAMGPVLNLTPMASLAGLMFVVAYDLVDVSMIRRLVRASRADAVAFVATMVGTWVLSLDMAIYLGVGISLVLFLHRSRLIRVVELVPDATGKLRERTLDAASDERVCNRIRVLHVEGPLFFGAAGELSDALSTFAGESEGKVFVVRLKRARGLDWTTASVLVDFATALREQGRRLILVGITADDMLVLERSGAADLIGRDDLFPTRKEWFSAVQAGLRRAAELCDGPCNDCPLALGKPVPVAQEHTNP